MIMINVSRKMIVTQETKLPLISWLCKMRLEAGKRKKKRSKLKPRRNSDKLLPKKLRKRGKKI